jgi:hypothetical protein
MQEAPPVKAGMFINVQSECSSSGISGSSSSNAGHRHCQLESQILAVSSWEGEDEKNSLGQ